MEGKLATYRTAETLGKSQLDLIIQVYDGAIAAFRSAHECYQHNDTQGGYQLLQRARRFITYLYTTLDPDTGGQIAENLGKLYAFVINQTSLAEATKDLTVIDDNINILDNVRLAWLQLKGQEAEAAGRTPPSSGVGKADGFTQFG